MRTTNQNDSRSASTRKLLWIGLLCLFLTLSMTHMFFPGDQALVTNAQGGTLPDTFFTFLPVVN